MWGFLYPIGKCLIFCSVDLRKTSLRKPKGVYLYHIWYNLFSSNISVEKGENCIEKLFAQQLGSSSIGKFLENSDRINSQNSASCTNCNNIYSRTIVFKSLGSTLIRIFSILHEDFPSFL